MRATRIIQTVALAVLLLAAALPASAGTAGDPEITDLCGAQVMTGETVRVTPNHVDICSGWFTTTASGLKVTLEMAGVVEETGGFWAVWWRKGDCYYQVAVDDAPTAEHPQSFTVGCGEPPEPECTPVVPLQCDFGQTQHPLPDNSVVRDGRQLRVTVDFAGPLSSYAAAHRSGSVLTQPHAAASATVGPVYAWMFGCSFAGDVNQCFEFNGDTTASGRPYTVGS